MFVFLGRILKLLRVYVLLKTYRSLQTRNFIFIFISSGRKRRGSETLSDSSGDEYYGTSGIIGTSAQLLYWNQSPSLRQQSNGTPISDSSSQNDQSNNGIGDGCRSSGPVMSECTAALVLMNLSHSPASNTHRFGDVTYTIKNGGSDSGNSPASSASIIPVSTQLYPTTNLESSQIIEDSQSKRMTQNQRRGHVGHVRCLPGGACLVGSDFPSSSSFSRLPEQQVQGI